MIQTTSGYYQTHTIANPTANITVKRNQIKSYGNSVYLKSGTNFEIELYNPLQRRVLVRIEIDGKLISSTGLVLNPGQRVYLERWIDEAKKFVFSTYEIENTSQNKYATANNGKVKVMFYDEVTNLITATTSWSPCTTVYTDPIVYTNPNGNLYYSNGQVGGQTTNYYSSTVNLTTSNFTRTSLLDYSTEYEQSSPKSLETGMTDKGETSKQNFDSTSGDFNQWTLCVIDLQILPESQKPVETNKIRSYCTDCGVRVRASSWKFCPSCGNKF